MRALHGIGHPSRSRHDLRTDSLSLTRAAARAGAAALVALLVITSACERRHAPARQPESTAADTAAVAPTPSAPAVEAWSTSTLGPALFVPGDSGGRVVVVLPDTTSSVDDLQDTATVRLFGRGGAVQVGRIVRGTAEDSTECPPWHLTSAARTTPWSVGFEASGVQPLPLDSISELTRGDSSKLAVAITKLASAIHDDPGGRFQGLPFSVPSAWRFTLPDGHQVVVAMLKRQINQEASPLEEHTLLIAQRGAPPDATDDTWSTVYYERSRGDEDTVETRELLGAITVGGNPQPLLAFARDYGDHMEYALLERMGDGHWRVRWTGSALTC